MFILEQRRARVRSAFFQPDASARVFGKRKRNLARSRGGGGLGGGGGEIGGRVWTEPRQLGPGQRPDLWAARRS